MGGKIWAESVEGKGSSFQVILPFEICASPRALPTGRLPSLPVWEGDPLCLLVADDNDINLRFIATMLRQMGHTVECAQNGLQALEKWRVGRFDCILMDVQMPVLDGTQALSGIRGEERETGRGRTPVVAITAHAQTGDRELMLAKGFDGYLAKPVRLEQLYDLLCRCSPAGSPRDSAASVAAPPAAPGREGEGVPATPEEMAALVAELHQSLRRNSLDSCAALARLEDMLPGREQAEAAGRMGAYLDRFDFKGAAAELAQLVESLGIGQQGK